MPISKQNLYESIHFADPELPFIFHCDIMNSETKFVMHWQDNPELLYFIEGEAEVVSDVQHEVCRTGDIAFFNCTHLHTVHPITESCKYYCLIIDARFLISQGIPVNRLNAQLCIRDQLLNGLFDQLIQEFLTQDAYYKTAIKACTLTLITRIFRQFSDKGVHTTPRQDKQIQMVKTAIQFLHENFQREMSIDEISAVTGFSKYYFCRGFKEVTGHTVIDYLNFVRCTHAQRLISSGQYNVGEAAELSGFSNSSYFSKIYRRYMGVLPSQEENFI